MSSILGLVGSKRRLGNCDVLVRSVLSRCAALGADTEIVYLDGLDISVCRGCLACAFKGRCVQKDDMHVLLEKMLQAKGLVLAAPTYLFSPSGIIKTVIDRALMLSPHLDRVDISRRAVTVSVAGNKLWNPLGIEFLNQLAFAYGFSVVDYLEAYAPGPAEVTLNEEYLLAAGRLAEVLLNREIPRRQPEENQCPVCYSRSFRISAGGRVQCVFCLTGGNLINGSLEIVAKQDHFWTPEHRKRHLAEWIFVTRDRFLKNRRAVKEKLAEITGQEAGR